ncbi:MAG: transglutaminase-like domain-containing protein [Cyclobacteriaceae bacterium]|nr:transglutaminase-like domain-containing protein [Cyclobacteriaceae bacterium]
MDEKELKALISLLDDEDKGILTMITEKITSLGPRVIPYLEAEWEHNFNPQVQARIENITHVLQFEAVKNRLEEWYKGEKNDLLEGMWIIATYQYPDLELKDLKQEMEQIYYEAWLNFKSDMHPHDQVKTLNGVFFWNLKFSPNLNNFHSPANSFINRVLESRKGNPISLCVIYLLIAEKLKLPVYGVNLPNLFVLTYKSDQVPQFYINVYNKGLVFTREDIENYIHELKLTPRDSFFQPCGSKDIIRRVLRNLVIAFEKVSEREKVDEVSSLLKIVSDDSDLFNV